VHNQSEETAMLQTLGIYWEKMKETCYSQDETKLAAQSMTRYGISNLLLFNPKS